MKRNNIVYYTQFYFYSILFFIEGLIYPTKKPEPVVPVPASINLLDEQEGKVLDKPSEAEAMANKAKLGFSAIPQKYKKKLLILVPLTVFFIFPFHNNKIHTLTK